MSTSIIERLEAFNLKTIGIDEIDLSKFILSKFGKHNQDNVEDTLKKKVEDLKGLSCCYWALGNLNPENTRYFCEEHCKMSGKIFVLMPYTMSESNKGTPQKPFARYSLWSNGRSPKYLPEGMKSVTGGDRTNRALVIKALYRLDGTFDTDRILKEIYPYYNTFLKGKRISEAIKTFRGQTSNACVQLHNGADQSVIKQIFKKYSNGNSAFLVGELEAPYCVKLLR